MIKPTIVTIVGTRPEIIKLAPLYRALERQPNVVVDVFCARPNRGSLVLDDADVLDAVVDDRQRRVALGAFEFLAQANYWLPTQVLVPQHDPGEAGLAFDAFGHTLMTPNQRMLIAGVYGLIALGVGSLAARFKALL